jgi:hypothetical protein
MQIVSFGVAALYSGMWCLRWVRAGAWEGAWGQLGLLSGMVCVGSVVGVVAWSANLQSNNFLFEAYLPGISRRQFYTVYASYLRLNAVFFIFYGFEFLGLIISKLMLLGRLTNNATQNSQVDEKEMSGVRRTWLPTVYRLMAGVVVVGSVVAMVADAVTGAYNVQAAGLYDEAADACDAAGKDTVSTKRFHNAAIAIGTKARSAQFAQASSEALTLLLVSVAFVVIVSWSVALVRMMKRAAESALRSVNDGVTMRASEANAARIVADAMQAATEHRRRLTAACVIVSVTFPVRAALDLLQAYASFNDPYNPVCGPCDPCQSTPILMHHWLLFTPEFQPIVVAMSSPLPITLSLWLLTKAQARVRLIAADLERARVGDGV